MKIRDFPLAVRLLDALAPIDRDQGSPLGLLAWRLGCMVLGHHNPEKNGERVVCERHFDSTGEQYAWPCHEVEALADVLGVDLDDPEVPACPSV